MVRTNDSQLIEFSIIMTTKMALITEGLLWQLRIMPELLNMLATYYQENRLLTQPAHDTLTQFLLDCSSLNLPSDIRLSPRQPHFKIVAKQCSNMIYAIHKERLRQLGALGLLSNHSSV